MNTRVYRIINGEDVVFSTEDFYRFACKWKYMINTAGREEVFRAEEYHCSTTRQIDITHEMKYVD